MRARGCGIGVASMENKRRFSDSRLLDIKHLYSDDLKGFGRDSGGAFFSSPHSKRQKEAVSARCVQFAVHPRLQKMFSASTLDLLELGRLV